MIRVVVADDDAAFRGVLVDILGADDRFEVVAVCADADSVISTAAEHGPDLVLLDVRMPGGGPTAAQGVKAAAPAHTRVVALSAQSGSSHVLAMLRSGAIGYLTKGNIGADLTDLLARAARGEIVVAAPGADRFLAPLWSQT